MATAASSSLQDHKQEVGSEQAREQLAYYATTPAPQTQTCKRAQPQSEFAKD